MLSDALPALFFVLQITGIKFIYNNFTCMYDD